MGVGICNSTHISVYYYFQKENERLMLEQIIKYQNAKLIFLTEKEDIHSIALIPASHNMAEDVLIIDMDSNCQNIRRELLKYNTPNFIGVSEKWDIEKGL